MNRTFSGSMLFALVTLVFSFISPKLLGKCPDDPAVISPGIKSDSIRWEQYGLQTAPPELSYIKKRESIAQRKAELRNQTPLDSCDLVLAGQLFEEELVNGLLPYWYGMEWDFNGYSAIPGKGRIACGYLVSTTLLHMGLNIDRYKLAQQGPENEARSLDLGGRMIHISEESTEAALESIDEKSENGLYFIGMGTGHVGFLLKRKGQLFLIHSNFLGESVVTIERANASEAMEIFAEYFLVPVTANPELMRAWLTDQSIEVVRS